MINVGCMFYEICGTKTTFASVDEYKEYGTFICAECDDALMLSGVEI